MKRLLYILLVLLLLPLSAVAQEDILCKSYLNSIDKFYRSGDYLSIVKGDTILNHCHFTEQERFDIYRYLIPALLNLGFDSLAEKYTYEFVKINPFYKYQPQTDPLPLQSILMKFYAFPKITVGYIGGLDRIQVNKILVYTMLDSMDYDVPYNSSFAILSFAFADYNFTRSFSAGMQLGLMYYNYRRSMDAYDFLRIDYIEKSSAYTLDFYLKYRFNFLTFKRFTPYVKLGGYVSYSPKFYAEIDVRVINDSLHPDFNLPLRLERYLYLPTDSRQSFRYGVSSIFGINMNLQRMNLFIEAGYLHDLVDYITPQGRYLGDLTSGFYYVSDDFYLDKLIISAGFSVNMKYKVKKKY